MSLSLAMVLSLERPMRELRVGGATRAVAASGAMVSLCARDGAILAVCMHVHDVLSVVRVTSIETLAQPREDPRLVEDGDWNVRATVLNTMCSLAF